MAAISSSEADPGLGALLTDCALCHQPCTQPKCIACIHTFCLRCLKDAAKGVQPGWDMPCPVCRRTFRVPLEGFEKLPGNAFVEEMLESRELCRAQEGGSGSRCEVGLCEEGLAVKYCVECAQTMCEACSLYHGKLRGTLAHQVMPLGEGAAPPPARPRHCVDHPEDPLRLHCLDCDQSVCLMCAATRHEHHRRTDLEGHAGECRELMREGAPRLRRGVEDCERELRSLDERRGDLVESVAARRRAVLERSAELKRLVDQECAGLLDQLESARIERLEGVDARRGAVERHLAVLASFRTYADALTQRGSAWAVAQGAGGVVARTRELDGYQGEFNKGSLSQSDVVFDTANIEDLVRGRTRLVGWVRASDEAIGAAACQATRSRSELEVRLGETVREQGRLGAELSLLRAEHDPLSAQLEALRAAQLQLEADSAALEGKLDALQKEKDSIDSELVKSVAEAGRQKQQLLAANAEADLLKEHLARSDKEAASLKDQLAKSNKEATSLKALVSKSEKEAARQKENGAKVEQEAANVRERMLNANREISSLKDQLTGANKESAALKERQIKSDKEAAEIKEQLDRANREAANLKEQLPLSGEETARLKEQLLSAEREVVSVKEQLINAYKEAASLNQPLIKANQETASIKEQQVKVEQEVVALREQLLRADKETVTLREQLLAAHTATATLKDQLAEANGQAAGNRDLQVAGNKEAASLRDQLVRVNKELGGVREQMMRAMREAAGLREQLGEAGKETTRLQQLQLGAEKQNLCLTQKIKGCGLEGVLVAVGLRVGSTVVQRVVHVSLERVDSVRTIERAPTHIDAEAAACVLGNTLYAVGIGRAFNEVWRWTAVSDWRRCEGLTSGRRRHCLAGARASLYALGGWVYAGGPTLSSVVCYNTETNRWTTEGELTHGVHSATCVTYNDSIYVFGGVDRDGRDVTSVQVYSAAERSCTVSSSALPHPCPGLRCVLWDTSVILLSRDTCLILSLDTLAFQERKNFKADVDHFGLVIDNEILYLAGGGRADKKDRENKPVWTCTDEVRSVAVRDVVEDKRGAGWKHHGKLPQPGLIDAFSTTPVFYPWAK